MPYESSGRGRMPRCHLAASCSYPRRRHTVFMRRFQTTKYWKNTRKVEEIPRIFFCTNAASVYLALKGGTDQQRSAAGASTWNGANTRETSNSPAFWKIEPRSRTEPKAGPTAELALAPPHCLLNYALLARCTQ